MNKWQIICPVVGLAVVVIFFALRDGKAKRDYFIERATYSVGRGIIEKTNSSLLISIGPGLQAKLEELLASPTHIAAVLLGDEPAPFGDGRGRSRLVLTNEASKSIVIRLRPSEGAGEFRFDVLGYLTPTTQ